MSFPHEMFPTLSQKGYDEKFAPFCDHTVLRAYTPSSVVVEFCEEAKKYGAKAVCVNPVHVALVHKELEGSGIGTATVIGFPLGANKPCTKAFEAREAVKAAKGCVLIEDLNGRNYPTPLDTTDQDLVYVGRIRRDLIDDQRGLTLWCCGDQVRKGAATNAVQIAELLTKQQPRFFTARSLAYGIKMWYIR